MHRLPRYLLALACSGLFLGAAAVHATLRTPAEAGPAKAALALSFPGWSDVKVAPVTKELAVGDAPRPR
jgi:hypothetical protein